MEGAPEGAIPGCTYPGYPVRRGSLSESTSPAKSTPSRALQESMIIGLSILSLTVKVFLNLSVLASCLSASRALTNMLHAVQIVSQAGEGALRPQETLRPASSVPYSA